MDELKKEIFEKLNELHQPEDFAHMIHELGSELMSEGQLEDDELVWEVAREIWDDRGLEDMDQEVYELYEKLL